MNATKRKFNALLQGMGTTRPVAASADTAPGDRARPSLEGGRSPATTTASSEKEEVSGTAGADAARIRAASGKRTDAAMPSDMPFPKTGGSAAAAIANLEFLAKRRRTGASTSTATLGGETKTTSSTAGSRFGGGLAPSAQSAASTAPAPRYCPGDREQLLRRLATFQELTDWTPKPDRINEIEWAKRGWVCQGKERLRCTLCSKELVVGLGADSSSGGGGGSDKLSAAAASEEALVNRYVDLIVAAHQDDCLWRRKGCDDSLLRLPLASPPQALADLRRRYDELCARGAFLPYEFNLRLPDGLDVDAVLATLPPTFFDGAAAPVNRVALALAVMGWQGLTNSRIGAVPNSASCHACLRRLGLWMFKSKQVDLATRTVLEPAPMDHLDAVREHRFFCPWKNGAVQRNPGARTGRPHGGSGSGSGSGKTGDDADLPGWAVLVSMLRNDAYLRNRVASSRRPLAGAAAAAAAAAPADGDATAADAQPPTTPARRPAATTPLSSPLPGLDGEHLAEEDEAARDAKDKERWARLRRVKSLFDPKGTAAKKLRRAGVGSTTTASSSSRPATAKSTQAEGGEGNQGAAS